MIAEHLGRRAISTLPTAYMRAGAWATIATSTPPASVGIVPKLSPTRYPPITPNRTAMHHPAPCCAAPPTESHTDVGDERFQEVEELCIAAGDKASLGIAMAGLVMEHAYRGRVRSGVEAGTAT